MKPSSGSVIRLSPKHNCSSKLDVNCNGVSSQVGEIGFKFRKLFPGYGYFDGEVVMIRPGAAGGKDRRCVYSDGDQEDLSLEELQALALENSPQRTKQKSNRGKRRKTTTKGEKKASNNCTDSAEEVDRKEVARSKKRPKRIRIPPNYEKESHLSVSRPSDKQKEASKVPSVSLSEEIFSSCGEIVPIDRAAEATLMACNELSKGTNPAVEKGIEDYGEEDEQKTDAWLEKVASLLGAGSRPKEMPSCQRKSLTEECEKLETPTSECSPIFPDGPLSDVNSVCSSLSSLSNDTLQRDSNQSVTKRPSHQLMDRQSSSASLPTPTKELFCLVNVLPGKRHGIKVFHVNDKKRTVGEVILEHPHGYIEAVISGSIEKSRVTNFVVAPEQYSVGDHVSLTLTLPPRLLKLPPTRGKSEHCKNFLDSKLKICGKQTKQSTSHHKPAGDISFPRTVQEKDGSTDRYRSSSSKGPALQESSNSRSMCDLRVTLDSLFYWSCERCTMMNSYSKSRCAACQKRKGVSSSLSALLSIASTAVKKASSVEEALSNVPVLHRPAIPEIVLAKLLSSHRQSAEHTPQAWPPPSLALDSYFYWMCGECTMKNSYKRSKCIVCENRKTEFAACSALLEIAKAASAESRTVKEAMNFITNERKLEIPEVVLSSLITCNALIGKKHEQRRCLRPKAFGCDFCKWHCDPMMQTENAVIANFDESCHMNDIGESVSAATTSPTTVSLSSSTMRSSEMSSKMLSNKLTVSCITSSMAIFLSKKLGSLFLNQLRWTIHSIEDTTLCQENNPFPLGMRVRRFFPCYGFHDGRVTKVSRRQIFDHEKEIRRPVLIYRVVYNDGDEEDFMHHEINSLRQIYDQYNVTSTAPPFLQLVPGTIYECQKQSFVKVVKNKTPEDAINPHEGGIAHVKICRDEEHWADLELELTQLQLNVTRKIPLEDDVALGPGLSCNDEKLTSGVALFKPYERSMVCPLPKSGEISRQHSFPPLLEWPSFTTGTLSKDQKGGSRCPLKTEKEDVMVGPGLWLHRNRCKDFLSGIDTNVVSSISDGTDAESPCQNAFRRGVSHPHTGWDPGNALDHVSWDPYGTVICELCKHDKDDHQILICDECHLGYHMYCVRPVIVNVPTGEWICPKCITGPDGGSTFCELVKKLENQPNGITEFMCLPYDDPGQFVIEHEYELQLFSPSTHVSKRQAVIGTSRSKSTARVGQLSFSRNTNNNDWLLPLPLLSQEPYRASLASMVASMKYSGMASYSEELVYSADFGVTEDMNDPTLDSIQPMSQRNLDIFKEFKENIKRGAFPPIRVAYDEKVGFSVEALAVIPRHTLITEYIGEVTTVEQSGQTSSDSLMVLLDTGDPKTSLIIDPTRTGNIARFLSGINNRSNFSRRKANVRTRRFVLDGKCRVALFTAKKIEPGDKLHYDYNAGVEGRTAKDWARNGFYDTSNFF